MTNKATMNGLGSHFVLVPLTAQGHMIPMVDLARLLAERGARVSLITSPVNAARIKAIINQVKESGLPIHFAELKFPCAEAGLPDGCENVDLLPSPDYYKTFFEATHHLREPLTRYLRAQRPRPTCMIADMCNPWTADVARELRMPRLIFHGPSCFFLLCIHLMEQHGIYDRITDDFEPVLVPELPQPVEVNKAQAPGFFTPSGWEKLRSQALEAESTADGVVMNTFDDLEHSYIELYRKVIGKEVWTIGPLCLYNKDPNDKAARGNKPAIDHHRLLSWLDSRKPKSVLYVSFGSLVRTRPLQLTEIGRGLEASNQPFIWVIKDVERTSEVDKWLSEGFEERVSTRGLVIKGWAPQVVILSHPAIGGFMTHCGWNSVLEALSAGVPMITWPCFADQFLNEKLLVDELGIGVAVGVKVPYFCLTEDSPPVAKRDDIEKAVSRLMHKGKEGEKRRKRAKELAGKAVSTMERGGPSMENIARLIQYASKHGNNDSDQEEEHNM
ncbi:UDP-glycosyltransferase 73E1-like [Elaeis guineensis]|uniref:Glycosyltransferase n=1 Tax=Elaeis guineensis var. tenera TaxID=51953 RepID=A0A6I9QXU3_ELAGV|nr:UDP-glycosyltransferase 73E1-like [Elaeis guineensis]